MSCSFLCLLVFCAALLTFYSGEDHLTAALVTRPQFLRVGRIWRWLIGVSFRATWRLDGVRCEAFRAFFCYDVGLWRCQASGDPTIGSVHFEATMLGLALQGDESQATRPLGAARC